MNVITTEQSRHFSHIVRKNQLKAVALTGKINGTRRRGLQGTARLWSKMDK